MKINVSVAELLTRIYSFDTPTTPDNIAVNIDEQIAGNPAASFAASHMYGSESTLANTSVDIQKNTILKKLRSRRHFRFACDKSAAARLLGSGEQRYIKLINNNSNN